MSDAVVEEVMEALDNAGRFKDREVAIGKFQNYDVEYVTLVNPEGDERTLERAKNKNGQYIGIPKEAKRLCDEMGIAPETISEKHNVCSIGFCAKDQKWFGWSHRAIFGFGVGSKVKKGDCAYTGSTPEELLEQWKAWYADFTNGDKYQYEILDDRSGIKITPPKFEYDNIHGDVEGVVGIMEHVKVKKCGKGEWTAETLDDAKVMAIDFANSVA
ncbi:MAG: hypothetical protein HRT36_02640 [Alphaproteobacteria bacterium]|nr:hypothetical protein [Alphaproteobacteria bacterium]